jgi:hypothetical protein
MDSEQEDGEEQEGHAEEGEEQDYEIELGSILDDMLAANGA